MVRESQVEALLFLFDQVPAPPQCRNAIRNPGRLEELLSRTTMHCWKSSLAASFSLQHFVLLAIPSEANLRRTSETQGWNHGSVQSHPAVAIFYLVCLFLSDDSNFPAAAAVAATEA